MKSKLKKGFTLIELLTVLVILGLIGMIAYPVVLGVLNDSKQSAYESQVKLVLKASKEWGIDHITELPECGSGSNKRLELNDLISGGYINGTVINGNEVIENPKKKGNSLSGYISITCTSNKYEYKYISTGD